MTKKKKIGLGVTILLLLIQFIPYNIKNNLDNPQADFFNHEKANSEVQTIVRAACYDCHSQETKTPWYGKIAPVKFWLNRHVRGGRMNLDFSKWSELSPRDRTHTIEEIIEEIEIHDMPLASYLWLHPEARLTAADRQKLINYFNEIR